LELENEFQNYLKTGRITLTSIKLAIIQLPFDLIESLIRNISGPPGFFIRRLYYKFRLGKLGDGSLIDVGVIFLNPKNIEISEFTWIDSYVILNANLGSIKIGKRCHIASFSIIAGRENITIKDFVGIAASVKIYSNSNTLENDKFMAGPMIPNEYKANIAKEIKIDNHVSIGANCLILPGAELNYGCVISAGSIVQSKVKALEIFSSNRKISVKRTPPNIAFEEKM
jgi:acetyltransferase-like isoleucine patch superfamily enzyme